MTKVAVLMISLVFLAFIATFLILGCLIIKDPTNCEWRYYACYEEKESE